MRCYMVCRTGGPLWRYCEIRCHPGTAPGAWILSRFLDHVYETAFADVFSVISVHGIPIFFPAMVRSF